MHNPYVVAMTSVILNKVIGINSYITIVTAVTAGIALPICASRCVIRNIPFLTKVLLGMEWKGNKIGFVELENMGKSTLEQFPITVLLFR